MIETEHLLTASLTYKLLLNRLLSDKNRASLSLGELKKLIGHGVYPMIAGAFKLTGRPIVTKSQLEEAAQQYLLYYRENPVGHTVVYPDVIDTLRKLKANGFTLGVCTNKPYEISTLILQALGIDSLFDGVSGGDNYPFVKPDSRHVLYTLELMKSEPDRAAMVGDSHVDGEASRKAGLPFILVTYGYALQKKELLKANKAIGEFKMLPKIITELSAH